MEANYYKYRKSFAWVRRIFELPRESTLQPMPEELIAGMLVESNKLPTKRKLSQEPEEHCTKLRGLFKLLDR